MEIKNLCKAFDDKIIFDNFSCVIPDGKVTFIIGSSGSGKTTLLRILAGLDDKFTGEIINITNSKSIVFQEPRLFPYLSVAENIKIVRNDDEPDELKEILKIVELTDDAFLLPSELSGGMKMRVSLARALYYNADLMLMDEPFSALDEELKNRMLPKIFAKLQGKTVIIISHDMKDVDLYSDHIIDLN
ncbi:MAG: ATP-binding cassette domain-containing protein [Ruminococcaceae bacterium]|nr:ATP-binding cassette domain-containing protein [Oscillospiraceae bacterium]